MTALGVGMAMTMSSREQEIEAIEQFYKQTND
jgi:hypothetical protein